MKKRAIQIRLTEDVIGRVDEVANLMGLSRSGYIAYLIERTHSEDFSPMTVAKDMLEKSSQVN